MSHNKSQHWDEYLVKAQSGDQVSYEKLLIDLLQTLPKWTRRRFGSLLDPMDVTQETLMAVHLYLNTFDPSRSAKAWISAIFNHKCVDQIRRLEREAVVITSGEEKRVDGSVTISGLGTNEGKEDVATELASELSLLEPEMRQAIEMTKLEGLSTDEAAKKAGISPAAMRKRVSRGLQQIRRHLSGLKSEDS